MEENLKKEQQIDSRTIFESLLPTINRIYKYFDYMVISESEYYNLVLTIIEKSKKRFNKKISYSKFLEEQIYSALFNKVKQLIENEENSFDIINGYINKKFVKIEDLEDSVSCFDDLNQFFRTYNLIPDANLLIKLINTNSVLMKMIEIFIKQFHTEIISGTLANIFDNSFLILTIETYCMINNIEIKESQIQDTNIYNLNNNVNLDNVDVYSKEISNIPLLSADEERELAKRVAKGDLKARNLFIESNLKLVVSIAKTYQGKSLPLLDLIQEGNLGLMTAIDKFDFKKGFRFSTYATYWIKNAMRQAIATKGRNIKLPIHIYNKIGAYKSVVVTLESKLNREPTVNEIAKEMGLSIKKVNELCDLQADTVSISSLVGDEQDTELENFIPAIEETPEDIVINKSLKKQVRKLFNDCNLNKREIAILMLRNGFDDKEPMTLEAIGKIFNITKERVRKIEMETLKKIRMSNYVKDVEIYIKNSNKCLESRDNKKRYIKNT